jgi:hypothetical protein
MQLTAFDVRDLDDFPPSSAARLRRLMRKP